MIVIKPVAIDDMNLVSSIAEPSSTETEWTAGTYSSGDVRIVSSVHSKYMATTTTTDNPIVGVAKAIPTWVFVSPTDKYAMFDQSVNTQSTEQSSIVIELSPSIVVGGIAGINVTGVTAVNVTMTDPNFGEVYNRDVEIVNNLNVNDWFSYLWSEFIIKTEFAFFDLPAYASATTTVTFTGPGAIGVGALLLGPVAKIGVTNFKTNVQLLDFNKYEEDDFGNLVITKRPYAKLVNFNNTVLRENLPNAFAQLESLRGVPAVYTGDETNPNAISLVYGIHRDNTLNENTPTACDVPIQVRGLT